MRVLSVVLVLMLCVCRGSAFLQVKVGDRSFPLETVKQLKEMMGLDDNASPHFSQTSTMAICDNPLLPQIFQSVCQRTGAAMFFNKLVRIITPLDPCEICANPSCYGCVI